MKIDLYKLNENRYNVDEDFTIPNSYYQNMDIRDIKDLHIVGELKLSYDNQLYINANITGVFILPCAITLEDVPYKFSTNIDETVGNIDEILKNNKNCLDILPIIWENIVSEVPIRVVKDGLEPKNIKGDNWELIINQD